MKKLFLFLPLCIVMFSLAACGDSAPEQNGEETLSQEQTETTDKVLVDHEINKENDIIIGSENAPHEMIAYYSPGCIHCLRLYGDTFSKIKAQYIDTGKLRYIIRAIPEIVPMKKDEDGQLTEFNEAKKNSSLIAINLSCTDHYYNSEAYFKGLNNVIEAIGQGIRYSKNTSWPYYNTQGIEKTFFHIGRYGQLNKDQYLSCLEDPLKQQFLNLYDKYGLLLTQKLKVKSLPAYFLDGQYVVFENDYNQKNILMNKLKENID